MNILDEMSPRLSVEKVSPNGEMVAVQIRNVTKESVNYGQGDADEYVLWLEGHAKGVRLNTTNAKNIVACLGTGETTDWIGRWVNCQGHWVRTPQGNEVFSWRFDKNPIAGQHYGPNVPVAAAPPPGQPGYDPSQAAQFNNPAAAPPPGSTAMPGHGAPAGAPPAAAPATAGSVPPGAAGAPPAAGPTPPPSGAPAGPPTNGAPAQPEQGQQWPPPAQNWDEAQAGEGGPDDVDFHDEGEELDDEPEEAPPPARKPRRRRKAAAATAAASE